MDEFNKSVAMYLRKSRAEENENTEAVLARHKATLMKYAAINRIDIKKIYEEVASGDSLFARPKMLELLQDVEDMQYTGVLCVDIDRLGRGNMQEQGLILNTLKDASTAIITPDKTYNLNDELDETQTEFKTFFARQELKMIKKRLSRGIRQTVEKGGYVSNPPFGYKRAYKDKTPTLEPDPEEADIVKLIFQLYLGDYGCQYISERLNKMGVKPHRGEEFNRRSVRYILTNEIYTGKIVWGKTKFHRPKKAGDTFYKTNNSPENWIIIDGLQPAIIGQVTFDKVGEMVRHNLKPSTHVAGVIENPLAGILLCRNCGYSMSRRPFNGRKYQHDLLICPIKGCMKASRLDHVELAFIYELESEAKKLEIELQQEQRDSSAKQKEIQISKMKSEHDKLITQRNKLYDLLEQGIYTVNKFQERESGITEKIDKLDFDIRTFETENKLLPKQKEIIIPKINNVLQTYWGCTPTEKNALLKDVVEKAYYYKTKDAKPDDFTLDLILKL
jgi:DNA invertase Pin-like site-specific DNA recombinase